MSALHKFMNIEIKGRPEKQSELLEIERSPLYARGVVVRSPEKMVTVRSFRKLSAAVAWCRRNHFCWLNRVQPPRFNKNLVEA